MLSITFGSPVEYHIAAEHNCQRHNAHSLGWPRNIVSPDEDKMHVLGSVPDAKKKVEGAGASPCREKSGNQTGPKRLT
jgi:hypothetical protein